jgi:hypothetical protein
VLRTCTHKSAMSVVVAEVDSIGAACTKSLMIVIEQVWPDG